MHLSWTLLIAACVACVVCDASPPWALWQFGRMIICVQPKVNPLIYNNYGCYCGFSGHGSPKDQIDQCCYVHDKCYDNTRELPECLSLGDLPHIKLHDYKCSDKTITCSASNDKCQAAVCDCDRVAANCFAQYHHTFNADYKNLPKEECTN